MADAFKAGLRRRAVVEGEDIAQRCLVDLALELGQREDGLHLAGKSQAAFIGRVEAGLDPLAVAGQHAGLAALVPDEEGEHADQVVQHLLALLTPQVHQHLGVAARLELVALGFELFTQLDEVEDLAIEHDPDLAVGAAHGLHAVFRVDHGQARMAQHRAAQGFNALLVHAAVLDAIDHFPDVVLGDARGVHNASNSTHGLSF